jgi:hypothetical protein
MKGNTCGCDHPGHKTHSCTCDGTNCSNYSCCYSQSYANRCSTDQITMSKHMLEKAFYKALMEIQVEKIKKKILDDDRIEDSLEKTAHLIVKTMKKQWQSDISKLELSKELCRELEEIFISKHEDS